MKKLYLVAVSLLLMFCPGNHPPNIVDIIVSPQNITPGDTVYISTQVDDGDGDVITFQWSIEDNVVSTDSIFQWVPADTGVFSIKLSVEDGHGGNDDSTFSLTVVSGDEPPQSVTLRLPYDIKTGSVRISWTPNSDNDWIRYEIWRSNTSGIPDSGGVKIEEIGYSTGNNRFDTLYQDSKLDPGNEYFYRVAVVDSGGNRIFSNEISVKTMAYEKNEWSLGSGHGVAVSSFAGFTYVAAKEEGFKIFGGGVPLNVRHNNDWSLDIYTTGNRAHVAFYQGGYFLYNITNPLNYALIDSIASTERFFYGATPDTFDTAFGYPTAVYTRSNIIYLAVERPALNKYYLMAFRNRDSLLRYRNPLDPALALDSIRTFLADSIGTLELRSFAYDLMVSGDYAYVAGSSGITVVDVSTFNTPFEVAYISTNDIAYSIYISGSYLFVAAGKEGILIFDITTPSNPIKIAQWEPNEDEIADSRGIYISGGNAYVADGKNGLRIIDISDIKHPQLSYTLDGVGGILYSVWTTTRGVKTEAHIADYEGRFIILSWE